MNFNLPPLFLHLSFIMKGEREKKGSDNNSRTKKVVHLERKKVKIKSMPI